MRKLKNTCWLILFFVTQLSAQHIERQLISVAGGLQAENPNISFTIGEVIIGKGNDLIGHELTHGVQQGNVNDGVPTKDLIVHDFQVFPNPSNGVFYIQNINNHSGFNYSVINIQGQRILKGKLTYQINELNLSHLPSGLYYLVMLKDSNEIHRAKLVLIK